MFDLDWFPALMCSSSFESLFSLFLFLICCFPSSCPLCCYLSQPLPPLAQPVCLCVCARACVRVPCFSPSACQRSSTLLGIFLSLSIYLLMAMLVRFCLPTRLLPFRESEVLSANVFLLSFSVFSPPNLVPSKYLSTLHLSVAPGADPGSAGSLTSRQPP